MFTCINIIPASSSYLEPDWKPNTNPVDHIKKSFAKLNQVREELVNSYQSEFLPKLVADAVNKQGRYKPVRHNRLEIGDIVLIKEDNTKIANFPMGIVKQVFRNHLDEVTGALVLKGSTREKRVAPEKPLSDMLLL